MRDKELSEFFSMAFDAFPGLKTFIVDSPNTVKVWAKTLENITPREAISVLSRWIDGTLPDPPVGFRRELFALDLKAVALKDRADTARHKAGDEARTKADRNSYRPSAAFKSIAVPFGRILELRSKVLAGDLELEDCERQIKQIVEEF